LNEKFHVKTKTTLLVFVVVVISRLRVWIMVINIITCSWILPITSQYAASKTVHSGNIHTMKTLSNAVMQ